MAASLDQARIVAFALEYGTSAAARRFRVSDSYVRRLKRSAAPAPPAAVSYAPARPGLRVVHAPSVPVSKLTEIQYAPPPQLVAGSRDFFKCPVCSELVKVPAGTRLVEWLAEQNDVHAHAAKLPAPAAVPAPAVSPSPDFVSELASGSEASQCPSSAVPVLLLGSACCDDHAGCVPHARVTPASSRVVAVVMAFVLPWLVAYWRVPLAVLVGLVVVLLCMQGVR